MDRVIEKQRACVVPGCVRDRAFYPMGSYRICETHLRMFQESQNFKLEMIEHHQFEHHLENRRAHKQDNLLTC